MILRRPDRKHTHASGVFVGQTTAYIDSDDRCMTIYAVARLARGWRSIADGGWEVGTDDVYGEYYDAGHAFGAARSQVQSGRYPAAALVALIAHPLPGDDYGVVVTVLEMSVSSVVWNESPPEPLPGMIRLRDQVTAAVRSVCGLSDSDFARPEPRPQDPKGENAAHVDFDGTPVPSDPPGGES